MLPSFSWHIKGVYTPKCVILHAALLHQGFPHCAIFLTAASRRSLVRVSVPVWRIILSNPLPVIGLVVSYTTNYLMGYRPIPWRNPFPNLPYGKKVYPVLIIVSNGYPGPRGTLSIYYSPVRHSSAEYKYSLLPFDLHVLSTPPAFILSQDQTLHNWNEKEQSPFSALTLGFTQREAQCTSAFLLRLYEIQHNIMKR